MKICYLILLHHKFVQAERLVRRLATKDTGFVIHIDQSADDQLVKRFSDDVASFKPIYAVRERAVWGSYDQAQAIIRLLQCVVQERPSFHRYVLISGQDYPIVSNPRIFEFFSAHPADEFMEAYALNLLEDAGGWSAYYRFRRHHVWVLGKRRVVPLWTKPMPERPLYHGSTWWALTRNAVHHVVEQFEKDSRFRAFLRTGFLVDEVCVPSLVMSSPFASRVTGGNVTYARWTPPSGPHPTVLTSDDLPALKASSKLFARKFDADIDSRVLNSLDEAL